MRGGPHRLGFVNWFAAQSQRGHIGFRWRVFESVYDSCTGSTLGRIANRKLAFNANCGAHQQEHSSTFKGLAKFDCGTKTADWVNDFYFEPSMIDANAIPISRPSLKLLGSEPIRATWEYLEQKFSTGASHKRGDGHPVVLYPGLASDKRAFSALRKRCETLGFPTLDWGRGFNTGPKGNVDAWMGDLAHDTSELLAPYSKKATLIGWSLGGFYAREVAKLLRSQVRQVITMGTPFNDGIEHTNVAWIFRMLNGTAPLIDAAMSARLRTPPPVPTTSIYSRGDGVVAWQSCRDNTQNPRTENVEVSGSHIGMGWNSAVIDVVCKRLSKRLPRPSSR